MTRRARTVAALVAIVLSAFAAAPAGAAETLSLDALAARVQEARGEAERGIQAPSGAQMQAVRDALGLPTTVELPSGQRIEVPMPSALSEPESPTADDFARARDQLRAMAAAIERARSTRSPGDAELRDMLVRAYRGVGSTSLGVGERIRRAVGEALAWLIDRILHARGLGSLVVWALLLGLVAGLVWLMRRGTVAERAAPRDVSPEEADLDWERVAEDARRQGDLDTAVRACFRALIQTLSARGFLRDEPSVTAGECRAATAARTPGALGEVADATAAFERVAYGNAMPVDADVELLRRALQRMRAA